MVAALRIAVTGATGFVGARLLEVARADALSLACLTRRDQPKRDGIIWVRGALQSPAALAVLCDGADAVIHLAGVISAPDAAGFEAGNVTGTANLLAAAKKANVRRFVHVSSLAARAPGLSLYGGSKARSEQLVRESGLDAPIVRPPAVYGPGDRETLELFRMAKRGLVLLPPEGRLSIIHADDLSRLLLSLAFGHGHGSNLFEPDDGKEGGYSHVEFAQALGRAVGRDKVRTLSMPPAMLWLGARLDKLLHGDKAKLTADRAAYFCHDDWTVDPACRPGPPLWQPRISAEKGLADTAGWYREKGWL